MFIFLHVSITLISYTYTECFFKKSYSLKNLVNTTDADLEPRQQFAMKHFRKNSQRLSAVNLFCKNFPSWKKD